MPVSNSALRALGSVVLMSLYFARLGSAYSQEGRSQSLDEVTVTAQRYEQNLQTVPISVSAFSGEQIEARATDGLKEFAQFVPNLTFSNAGASGESGNIIYIRGVGNNDSGIEFSPGVGVYVDGVYIGVMRGLDLGLLDVERMEVLRGPQGTLFGRNTTGGAINVIPRRPGNEFAGRASLTAGNYGRLDGKLTLNAPIVADKLTARLVVASRNRDGFGKHMNFSSGARLGETGDVDSLAGRAVFDFTPVSRLSFVLSVDASKSRAHVPPYTLVATCPGACTAVPNNILTINAGNDPDWGSAFIPADPFTNYATGPDRNDLDSFGAALIATWDVGERWTVKSLTSHREVDTVYEVDVDTGPYALLHSWQITDQEQLSQELLLTGSSFGNRLESALGVFFYKDETFSDRPSRSGLATAPPPVFRGTAWQAGENRSWAVYGQSTFDLTNRLSLTAGMRYTEDEVDGRGPATAKGLEWDAVTGRAGVEFAWTDHLMTYVSVARGYKSGGLNTNASTVATFIPFDPEKIQTYEVGVKSDLLDQRLRLNVAAFHSDYEEMQFRQRIFSVVLNQFITVTDNAARAKIDGVEAELSAIPIPGLTLNLSLGYIDARYTEIETGAPITTANDLIETPKWNGAVGGEYALALGDVRSLIARLDYSYRTATEHDLANSPRLRQPAYGLLNGRLTFEAGTWSISAFGTNLTDERYFLNGIDFVNNLGFASVQYARPRELGLTVTKDF